MEISLLGHCNHSRLATLDTVSGTFKIRRRRRVGSGEERQWEPMVPQHGVFDVLGGLPVALYRETCDSATLIFQFGLRSVALDAAASSEFRPELENDDPGIFSAWRRRSLCLRIGGTPIFQHRYRPGRTLLRLLDLVMIAVPAWPPEEEDYDLLYLVHRILAEPGWRRVLRGT